MRCTFLIREFDLPLNKMAGDKIVDCTQNGNSEKISENGDLGFSLNLEDDIVESIEYVPCPEFQFSVSQSPFYLSLLHLASSPTFRVGFTSIIAAIPLKSYINAFTSVSIRKLFFYEKSIDFAVRLG